MQKLSTTSGIVHNETLIHERDGRRVTALVGTPAWYAWLETATTFTFECEAGQFTAHKARAGNRRGGWYWRAYRRSRGKLTRCYLGVSANLTLACLREAAYRLATPAEGIISVPRRHHTGTTARSPSLAAIPILNTKCTIPRLPVQHVPHTHLVTQLERAAFGPMTLVSAPAGSGKITLLAE